MAINVVRSIAILLYLLGIGCHALAERSSTEYAKYLTKDQTDWLKKHPKIRLAFPSNLPPYSYMNDQNQSIGFVHDWYEMVNSELGTNIIIVPQSIKNLYSGLDNGMYDGIAGITYSTNIDDGYVYTEEIVSSQWSVFTSKSAKPHFTFSEIADQTIAIKSGTSIEKVLRESFPNIKLIRHPTFHSALESVDNGEAFALFAEARIVNHLLRQERIYGVVENFVASELNVRTGSIIRKDWLTLVDIINKAQQSISLAQRKLIVNKWLNPAVNISHLNLEEIKWLQEKKFIDINFYHIPPYLTETNGETDGFLVDYFKLLENMLGFKLNIKMIPFEQFPLNADGSLPDASFTLPREQYQNTFEFTEPFYNSSFGLFTRLDHAKILSFNELNNHVIGLIEGAQPSQRKTFLLRNPGVAINSYSNMQTMVNDLLLKKIDSIYAEASVMRSYLSSNMVQAVELNWLDGENVIEQSMAVRKDLSPLAKILSKSWSKIDKQAQLIVFDEWLVGNAPIGNKDDNAILKRSITEHGYSSKQAAWISENPVVYYSDVSWKPYIDVDSEIAGIGKDYLDLVAQDSGINFVFVPSTRWSEVIKKLKKGDVAFSVAAGKTDERMQFANFSEPYISSAMSIVTSDKYAYIQNLEQLEGLTVAIPEGLYLSDILKKNYSGINLVYTDTIIQSLELVAENKADAFIGSMAVVASHLRKAELFNLRVSGLINRELAIHFMIGKQYPELLGIINKTLASIDDVERLEIANRWFAVKLNTGIRSQTVWFILLAAAIIVGVSLYWIRRLKLEIHQKNLIQKALKSARVDAELANKAKSEFLANMSHEIRTPMNAIVGFSHLLSESELSDKQQSYLRSIRVGSDGLLHIINDILDLSKIEAGKMEIEYTDTDLVKMIEEIELLFYRSMKDKGITLSVEVDNDVPRYLLLDANRVRQILLNVIGNAQKFTDFGQVTIKVYVRNCEEGSNRVDLFVDVVDTGIGIARDSLERVFENFEQHNKPNSHRYGGTGLGLAISRKLAQKMNGELTAISNFGKGSCFTLKLHQVRMCEELSMTVKERHSYEFEKSVVLVVDDIESNRILLTKYLEGYPFEIFIAENGLEAVEMARKTNPDIVLMDLRMPEMDGYEATELIKAQSKTIVIALTASALEDEESIQKQKMFDAFLRKPILKSKLVSTMADYLTHNYQVRNESKVIYELGLGGDYGDSFRRYILDDFLGEIDIKHQRGDVENIAQLAEQLREKSIHSQHQGLVEFADELIIACDSFDVEKIDFLVNLLLLELRK